MANLDPTKSVICAGGWLVELLDKKLNDGSLIAVHHITGGDQVVVHNEDGTPQDHALSADYDLSNVPALKSTRVKVFMSSTGEAFTEGAPQPAEGVFGVAGTLRLDCDGKTVTATMETALP